MVREAGDDADKPIVEMLKSGRALTQAEIAEETGLNRSTVSRTMADLKRGGLVEELPSQTSDRKGRKRLGSRYLLTANADLLEDLSKNPFRELAPALANLASNPDYLKVSLRANVRSYLTTALIQYESVLRTLEGAAIISGKSRQEIVDKVATYILKKQNSLASHLEQTYKVPHETLAKMRLNPRLVKAEIKEMFQSGTLRTEKSLMIRPTPSFYEESKRASQQARSRVDREIRVLLKGTVATHGTE